MEKTYNPKNFEDRLYKEWEENGCFKAVRDDDKVPFTVMMPPPNITGKLHMGHAMDETMQDTVVRFKRMQGYCALWLPGTDHASIATEVKIVEQMKKEGLTKDAVGRDGFLKRAWEWKDTYSGKIVTQLKKLGSSCDWSRLTFTMDEKCSKAVREVFFNLYNKKLIYRGSRIINWCPCCKTALSDAEVEYAEENGNFWHIKYFIENSDTALEVATTRPETMFGDTSVAVNPKDKRYKHLIGKNVILPVVNKPIPVVGDGHADMEFGTGVVKITPAHDPNDFEVGLRHNLPVVRVMNDDGTMNALTGKYDGMDRYECRKKLVEELKELGNLVSVEPHAHNVGHCYRCGSTVEPIVSKQWFVKMEGLARPAINAVLDKKITFVPERFAKTYYNWMENVKDWCISRQLWWGHRIPVWYCGDCGKESCSKTDLTVCPHCGSGNIRQDEDVLDTWFSSALWPFSTLGYPDDTSDLEYFYPTDVLVTGYDIIFFWVARMIFSGLEHMRKVPFRDVLFHGLVRDEKGRKMSKSLGNGVDPLEVIDKYGADSLRFSLLQGVAPGNDTRYSDTKVESCRNFMNKIWNASRFVIMNCEGRKVKPVSEVKLLPADKWIIAKLQAAIRDVTLAMNKFELGVACQIMYDFMWSDFCDWYIELVKPLLYSDDEAKRDGAVSVLVYVLENALKLLHPVIPFVTDEIYRSLPNTDGTIMTKEFPRYNAKLAYKKDALAFEGIMDIVKAVRAVKTELDCPPAKKVSLYIVTENKRYISSNEDSILKLAGAKDVKFICSAEEAGANTVTKVLAIGTLYIPMGELVDFEKEKARLKSELEKVTAEIARADGKLNNTGFISKAPKKLVEEERAKLNKYIEMREKILAQLKTL
ncbi:MAG: valine--tRNA ligase [Clostridia bacterium]|jgi:valyl-tRNA synthetase|nr:valine--tRNA ligase [Clostridia bacterium]